jgi:hypothetical protein
VELREPTLPVCASCPSGPSTYNGWKNYETWAVHLWLSNDQGSDVMARELVAEAVRLDPDYPRTAAADALRCWTEEVFIDPVTESEGVCGLAVDLLRGALSDVDWLEVAAAFGPES